jgi:asparagine synthase (glutamine-hydrolysing)
MCGIFGAVSLTDYFKRSDYNRFVSLTDLVHYRGPNAAGYFSADMCTGTTGGTDKFNIFFGHRRLSIIDLTAASNQPLADDTGLWILFNGEIFNYVELRRELERLGHHFRTDSDTETILKVYAEWGPEGFQRLNGMWAFALLDFARHRVVLSRDRFSIKPLYYFQKDRRFYFASEIKQLLPLLDMRRVNEEVLSIHLRQGLLDFDDQTFFLDIRSVKPKHNLILDWDSGSTRQEQYWDYEDCPEARLPEKQAIESFRELFRDSVRIRLRSDVKVGALLSGGLDSSAICLVGDQFQPGSFETYSIVSEEKAYSEESFVDALCLETKLCNHKLLFRPDEALDSLEKIIYHNDEPFGGFTAVAQYQILEKIRKETDIVVVLSGQGGDETLMGYLKFFFFYVKDLARRGHPLRASGEMLASLWNGTVVRQFRYSKARRYMASFSNRAHPYLRAAGELRPIWLAGDLARRQRDDIDSFSVPALTHYEDRNSMAHSLEIRLPFLDHRLVNFALSLPVELKLRRGWTKYVLRQAFPDLPAAIRWRRDKQGFLIPEHQWLVHRFGPQIRGVFAKSILEQMGLIDARAFLRHYESFARGDWRIPSLDISRMFITELWARTHFA